MTILPVLSHRGRLAVFLGVMLLSPFAISRGVAQSDNQGPGAEKSATTEKGPGTKPPSEKEKDKDKDELPPLPAEKSVPQTMMLDGKPLHYTVTVGALPVRDGDGKLAGEVVLTAYTMPGDDRPVTFALNGGPGAASVFLNLGAIGPKHLQAGNDGDSPSAAPVLTDNPGTW